MSFFSRFWQSSTRINFLPKSELQIKHNYHNVCKAIIDNNIKKLISLQQNGVEFKSHDFLTFAIKEHASLECFEFLFSNGCPVNTVIYEIFCKTPLELVAFHDLPDNHEILKLFLNNNGHGSNKFIHHIILSDDVNFFRENNFLEELTPYELKQCFYMALARERYHICDILETHVNIDKSNDWFLNNIPFVWKKQYCKDPYKDYVRFQDDHSILLHFACANGDLNNVKKFVEIGYQFEHKVRQFSANNQTYDEYDCLEYAIRFGNDKIVSYILAKSKDKFQNFDYYVNIANNLGEKEIAKILSVNTSDKKRKRDD